MSDIFVGAVALDSCSLHSSIDGSSAIGASDCPPILPFILALAICRIRARREPRSAPDVSVHTDDPDTNDVAALCVCVKEMEMIHKRTIIKLQPEPANTVTTYSIIVVLVPPLWACQCIILVAIVRRSGSLPFHRPKSQNTIQRCERINTQYLRNPRESLTSQAAFVDSSSAIPVLHALPKSENTR